MDVRIREVPEQVVVTEQRMVDQKALEEWLPGAMARVHRSAGDAAAGTAEQRYLLRDHVANEPVFIVIYEGNPNDGETAVECCTPLQSGDLGNVYVGIENWIAGHGSEIAAAPRETFWTDFFAAAAEDEVFDVAFPVR
jgi:hypothetical protein